MAAPVEPEYAPFSWRELFGWRFWVNYVVCLLVTIWIPLASLQATMDGKPVGKPRYEPMYEIYHDLWLHPDLATPWLFALAHWGITFAMMVLVWWLILRRSPASNTTR